MCIRDRLCIVLSIEAIHGSRISNCQVAHNAVVLGSRLWIRNRLLAPRNRNQSTVAVAPGKWGRNPHIKAPGVNTHRPPVAPQRHSREGTIVVDRSPRGARSLRGLARRGDGRRRQSKKPQPDRVCVRSTCVEEDRSPHCYETNRTPPPGCISAG